MEIVEKSSHYKMEGENNGPLMLLLTKRFHLKETQEMQWSKKRGAELRVYCLRGTCVLPEPLPFTRLSPNLFLPKQCQLTRIRRALKGVKRGSLEGSRGWPLPVHHTHIYKEDH